MSDKITYTDAAGSEYTETTTGPIDLIYREEELIAAGYTIKR